MLFEKLFLANNPFSLTLTESQFYDHDKNVIEFQDPKLQRRFHHYAMKAKELKKELSFKTINWEESRYNLAHYRECTFIPTATGCDIQVSGDLTALPKELALMPDAEILKFIDDVILITEAEPFFEPGPRVIYVNEAFERFTGYSLEDIFGKTPRILQGHGTSDESRFKIREGLSSWSNVTIELLNYKKDKKEFMIELKISPRKDEAGWYTHWVSVQRDISERILLENQLSHVSKFAYLGELASGIGHEINNPVAIIKGLLEMNDELLSEAGFHDETVLKNQERMKLATERILQITASLRFYTRNDPEVQTPFSVNDLIRETIDILFPIYSKEGIHLEAVIPHTDVILPNHRIRLQQVLLNLIGNAKDACAEISREKQISVQLEVLNDIIKINVRDSGVGIPNDIRDRIFDSFFTTKTRQKGTGLGLSIVKKIIQELGGSIEVQSEMNKGTTFCISLPNTHTAITPKPVLFHEIPKAARGHLHALIVEDEPDLREILAIQLKKFNVTSVVCANGAEALQRLQTERFDIVFSDYTMPVMNGAQLFSRIKGLKLSAEPKLVMISGGALEQAAEKKEILSTINMQLEKPVKKDSLHLCLKKLFPEQF